MSRPATRRAALGAILAAPLASVPARAKATVPGVSPELARLVAECVEADHALHDCAKGDPDFVDWPRPLCVAAGLARGRVAGFTSASHADVQAKLRLLAVIYPIADIRCEAEPGEDGHAYLDNVALSVVADILELMEVAQ